MATQRRYSIEFKRQVVQEYQADFVDGSLNYSISRAHSPFHRPE